MSVHGSSEGRRETSRRRKRRPEDPEARTYRVAEVRRKPRHRGPLGWLKKLAYSQRSPLITLALLVAGIGLTALLLVLLTRATVTLPADLGNLNR